MSVRRSTALAATRALGLCLGFWAVSLIAAPAAAQDARIAVQDPYGFLLPDASVSYRTDNGEWIKAVHDGNGTATLVGVTNKVQLDIAHPYYGHRDVEFTIPQDQRGVIVVRMDTTTSQTKFLNSAALVAPNGANSPTNPVPVNCSTGVGCQLPDQQGHGGSGTLAATSDLNPGAGYRVAENLQATGGGTISNLCWWGIYFNFTTFSDCAPGPGDHFQITYYNDDAGGNVPGSLKAGPFPVVVTKFPTGNVVCAGTTCISEWQFQAAHAPVVVGAGECYWVEIVNNTITGSCFWLWDTAPPGDGRSAQAAPIYAQTDYDLAVCVDVAITPNGCGAPPGPPNDNCANATPISGTGTFSYDNTNATTDGPGHTECNFFGQTGIDRDLWWCWTAPSSGQFTLETCGLTSTDSKIAVYASCACPVGSPLACNDDFCGVQSSISGNVTAGGQYLLRIGVYPGAFGGPGAFRISGGGGGVTNDFCTDAIAVAVPSVTAGTTTGATVDNDVPDCVTGNTSPGVWYSVTGTGNTMTADTCNGATSWDSKISVYCGDCANAICVNGNDDTCGLQSQVSWCSQFGATYLVLVHGFGGQSGPFELRITDNGVACTPTVLCLPNGACCTDTGCVLTDSGTCALLGGSFQGPGTSCGGFEYFAVNCTQNWEDISQIGTALILGDDDGEIIPLPFPFTFFDNTYTQVGVCSNGYLTFGTTLTDFSNDPIPDTDQPNDIICPLWDDLDPSAGGQVLYHASGVAPNRAMVISWINVPQFATGDSNTFQAILFENHNRISFRYLNVTPEAFAGDYTIGVENASGTDGTSVPGTTAALGVCLRFVRETIPSDCPEAVSVDITPGVCPNPLNYASEGAVRISILGTPTFDVSQIDINTVLLERSDGVGFGLSPYKGPPGPGLVIGDVATPWHGPIDQCHTLGADGFVDATVAFRASEIYEDLDLHTLPFDSRVAVRLSGYLTDGRWFQGEDTLTLVPPPTVVNLKVRSNLDDAWIEAMPRDLIGDADGFTNFDRWYSIGSVVTLTATPDSIGHFIGWRVNGQMQTSPVIQVTMSQNTAVWAIYAIPRSTPTGGVILK